MATSQSEERK